VTDADLNYVGSISIDPNLMASAGILPYEFVHVNNVANGKHWETYAIPGEPGDIVLNGPPAHHFSPGDKVVIYTICEADVGLAFRFDHTVVFVDDSNNETTRERHTMIMRPGQMPEVTKTAC
jgi:aspartate 1-decarboxylase